jgi:metallo-beta-lactamase family protein
MKLIFYGGARWVTGANYLLTNDTVKIMIDCGLFQGKKYAEDLNYRPFQFNPKEIDFVAVTHSHIDHIGRLPKMYKEGFRGKVFATEATQDIMTAALPDNLERIVEEAERAGHPPLFTEADVSGLLSLVEGVSYNHPIEVTDSVKITFHDAGHILGSSIVEINWQDADGTKKIFFSGDIGNPPTPLLRPTEFVKAADYLVVESAYGDRVHEEKEERRKRLVDVIKKTIAQKGVLIIPAFAIERTQELLFEMNELVNAKTVPPVPVFVDSPLAIQMTAIYKKHADYFNQWATYLINSGDNVFDFPGLKITKSAEESKAINNVPPPKVIIAGSGMSHGGRVLYHEQRYLSDPNSAILFVGYQVDGSLGRHIQRGDKEVTILGQPVKVNCRVESITSYSSHADQKTLINWTKAAQVDGKLKRVFIVQGEESPGLTLSNLIRENLGVEAVVPLEGESFEL